MAARPWLAFQMGHLTNKKGICQQGWRFLGRNLGVDWTPNLLSSSRVCRLISSDKSGFANPSLVKKEKHVGRELLLFIILARACHAVQRDLPRYKMLPQVLSNIFKRRSNSDHSQRSRERPDGLRYCLAPVFVLCIDGCAGRN